MAKFTIAGCVSVTRVAELQVDEEPANDTHRIAILFRVIALDAQAFEGWVRDQLLTAV